MALRVLRPELAAVIGAERFLAETARADLAENWVQELETHADK